MKTDALIFFCIVLLLVQPAFSQKPEYLQLQPQHAQINNSIFSTTKVVDTRFDTIYMGFVQKGAFNRKAPIQLKESMNEAVQQFSNSVIENAHQQNGTLLVNIRNFFLSEMEKATAETGTFIFKAGCYLKNGDNYNLMFTVDTTITLKSMWDVTKKLEEEASKQLGNIIARAAVFDTNYLQKTSYSYEDIEAIDSIEKNAVPVYNVPLPQKGLYASFKAFKNNQPTDTNFVEELDGKSDKPVFYDLKADNSKGKPLKSKDYYAICDGSQLYISTGDGMYATEKKHNDFYFIGKGKEANNAALVSSAYLMFGLLGGLMASIPQNADFEFKIDHSTGEFLPVKKIR